MVIGKNEGMKLNGILEIVVKGPDGRIKQHDVITNAITLIGFENINDLITGAGGSPLTHIGVGWGVGSDTAFADTQTDFQGTDQDRKAVTPSKISEKILELVGTWIATEPTGASFPITIYEIGLFWGVAPDKMMCRAVRPAGIVKDSADTVEITYRITMS